MSSYGKCLRRASASRTGSVPFLTESRIPLIVSLSMAGSEFRAQGAVHQDADRLGWALVLVDDLVDLLHNRHLDVEFSRELEGRQRRRHPFGNALCRRKYI